MPKFDDRKNSINHEESLKQDKQIVDLDYIVPDHLNKKYLVLDGSFISLDNKNTVLFQDKGKRLVTSKTDINLIRDMLDLSQHKNWDKINLKGIQEFKRLAWLEAESRGIITTGFKPTELDKKLFNKIRQEKSLNSITNDNGPDIKTKPETQLDKLKKIYNGKIKNLNQADQGFVKTYEGIVKDIVKSLPKEHKSMALSNFYEKAIKSIQGENINFDIFKKEVNYYSELNKEQEINL